MTDRKLRMLIVGAFPSGEIREHGGILTSCRVLLGSSLPERVSLILVDSTSPTVPPPPFLNRLMRALMRIGTTARHCLWKRPDVMLLFASPGASFAEKSIMAGLGRVFGVKTMMFPRGAALIAAYRASRLHRLALRIAFHIPTVMLCQGTAYEQFFVEEVGLDAARCALLRNWTATARLLKIGAERSYMERGGLVMLFLGWVEPEKGIFELLDSAQRLLQDSAIPPFTLVIAGEGSASARARTRVDELGLARVVRLPGWIDAEAAALSLQDADLLILPSYMEGMPNAVIEAMAAGLPVVATDVGAVTDVVSDGINGFVIPPRDTGRLTDALAALLANGQLRERMGRAGWRIAKEKFSAERAVDQLIALAERICAREARAEMGP